MPNKKSNKKAPAAAKLRGAVDQTRTCEPRCLERRKKIDR